MQTLFQSLPEVKAKFHYMGLHGHTSSMESDCKRAIWNFLSYITRGNQPSTLTELAYAAYREMAEYSRKHFPSLSPAVPSLRF
jgi:hypothetical protein